MDPQACFQRILDAIDEQDADEFVDAFQDLAEWLAKGGFPPVVQSIGNAKFRVGALFKWEDRPRRTLTDRPFVRGGESHTIRTVDPNQDGAPFEFVTWRGDKAIATYRLGQ